MCLKLGYKNSREIGILKRLDKGKKDRKIQSKKGLPFGVAG